MPQFIGFLVLAFLCSPQSHAFSVEQALFPSGQDQEFLDLPGMNRQALKGGSLRIGQLVDFERDPLFYIPSQTPFHVKTITASLYQAVRHPQRDSVAYPYVATGMETKDHTLIFFLNPQARFHDQSPITALDVVKSFHFLCQASPVYQTLYASIEDVKAQDPYVVQVSLKKDAPRSIAFFFSQMPIFSHKDLGKDLKLEKNFQGSGPYRMTRGKDKSYLYQRVENWWAKDLFVMQGLYNVDTLIYHPFSSERALLKSVYEDDDLDVVMGGGLFSFPLEKGLPLEWNEHAIILRKKGFYSLLFNAKKIPSSLTRQALYLLLEGTFAQESPLQKKKRQDLAYFLLEKDEWRLKNGLWVKADKRLTLRCPVPHGRWVGKLSPYKNQLALHGIVMKIELVPAKKYIKTQKEKDFDLLLIPTETHNALPAINAPFDVTDSLSGDDLSLKAVIYGQDKDNPFGFPVPEEDDVYMRVKKFVSMPENITSVHALWDNRVPSEVKNKANVV